MKYKILLILTLNLFFISSSFSQNTDSILDILKNEKNYSNKIDYLFEIASSLKSENLDTCEFYCKQAIEISIENNDYEKAVYSLHKTASISLSFYNYDKALEYYKTSIEYSEKVKNDSLISLSNHKAGNCCLALQKLQDALKYYYNALEIREKNNDIEGIAATTNNIGAVYFNLKNFDKSIEYYEVSLEKERVLENKSGISSSLNNIGLVYMEQLKYDSALFYIEEALLISLEVDNEKTIANKYNNIGLIYKNTDIYDKALENFFKAVEIFEKLQLYENMANTYNNISQTYYYLENYDLSVQYAKNAYEISEKLGSVKLIINSYANLANSYGGAGLFEKAFEYSQEVIIWKDSVFSLDFNEAIAEMQTKYETEKIEKENEIQKLTIEQQNIKNKNQKNLIYLFLGIILISIIFTLLLIKQIKAKKSAYNSLELKNVEILQQKEEIIAQNENLEHANKEITSQKDIIQKSHNQITSSINYASRIQKALLPSKSIIDSVFPENFIFWKPRDIVSGDFYYSKKVNEFLIIAAADCTGHGVPGAFMSMLGISFLNEIVTKREITKASHVLDELRNLVKISLGQTGERGENQDGMDISLCVINTQNLKSQFAGANNPLFLVRRVELGVMNENIDNENSTLKTQHSTLIIHNSDKMPIGVHPRDKQPFTNNEIQLQKNDSLYLFSDGYTDQLGGEKNQKYKSEKFKNLLSEISENEMKSQAELLEKELNSWKNNNEQTDDVLVIGIKI